MRVREGDLTAEARIRIAALEGFARDGVAGTTIRDVASAAKVSPGLVQHHFKTKADLEQAVNEYVVQIAVDASAELEERAADASIEELFEAMGQQIVSLVREHRSALLYVIRSAAAGEAAGLAIFDGFVALVASHVDRLSERGVLRDNLDRLWVSLQVVILDLGTVLLEPAIDRHLDGSLRDSAELERWRKACTELLRHGFIR